MIVALVLAAIAAPLVVLAIRSMIQIDRTHKANTRWLAGR